MKKGLISAYCYAHENRQSSELLVPAAWPWHSSNVLKNPGMFWERGGTPDRSRVHGLLRKRQYTCSISALLLTSRPCGFKPHCCLRLTGSLASQTHWKHIWSSFVQGRASVGKKCKRRLDPHVGDSQWSVQLLHACNGYFSSTSLPCAAAKRGWSSACIAQTAKRLLHKALYKIGLICGYNANVQQVSAEAMLLPGTGAAECRLIWF